MYKNGTLDYILTPEGRIMPAGDNYTYEYYLKDHLGNTRATYHQNGALVQTASYYPFGLRHEPKWETEGDQKYLYNGKELQEDLDWYDYGARMYDASLGRFMVQDAFAEKYVDFTPYQYGANNPLRYVDINGDSLQVAGSGTDAFIQEVNTGLGGFYEANVDDNGMVTISSTGKEGKMSKQQKKFYKSLNKVASHKKTTSIEIVEGDPDVEIGGYYSSKVDITDVQGLGSSSLDKPEVVSAQGALGHEVTEQYKKQVKGAGINAAHAFGLASENKTNASSRVGMQSTEVHNKAGQRIGSSINSSTKVGNSTHTVNIVVINGNVNRVLIDGTRKKN